MKEAFNLENEENIPEMEEEEVPVPKKKTPIGLIILALIFVIVIIIVVAFVFMLLSIQKEEPEILFDISEQYERILPNDTDYVYVPIFGTNGLRGYVFPRIVQINSKLSYKNASLEYFGKYVEILRNEFGEERVLWLDGGDQYTGGVELVTSNNLIITDFMNAVKATAANIGNHEYDLDYNSFSQKVNRSNFPYVAANIYDNRTHEFKPISNGTNENNGHKKYIIKEIKLSNEDIIKIGIIGVGAKMEETGSDAISTAGWDFFEFHEIRQTLIDEVKEIKKKYSDLNAVVAIVHNGMNCYSSRELKIYTKNMSQTCEGDLYNLLISLEEGLLDAVFAGDKSFLVHDWVNGMPVIENIDGGQYTNIMYLPFKKIDGVYKLIKDEIKIESPLPNCELIFNNTKICDGVTNDTDYKKAGSLIKYKYHDIKMEVPNSIQELIDKYYPDYKSYNEDQICLLYGVNTTINGKDKSGDGYVINLLTDIIKNETNSDIVIINTGGLRALWSMGKLTKADIFSMMPYEDYFCTVSITGADLKFILNIVQVGERGYYATSGLKQIIKVSEDGKKKFHNASLWVDGEEKEIDEDKVYRLGTIDYIVLNYGDDFADVKKTGFSFRNIECENWDPSLNWNLRFIEAFRKLESIDVSKFVDSERPRLLEIEE